MAGKFAIAMAGAALVMAAGPVSAATVFEYTGGFQSFTAPTTGIYNINSYGAQGGGASGVSVLGGLGAHVGGDFSLTQGDVLTILVGGMGGNGGFGDPIGVPPIDGGGGGGSFVYTAIQGTYGLIFTPSGVPGGRPTISPSNTFTGYVQLADAAGGGGVGRNGSGQRADIDGQAYGGGFDFPGSGGFGGPELSGAGAGYITSGRGSGSGDGNAPGFGGQGGVFTHNVPFGSANDGHGGFGGGGSGGTSSPGNGGQTGGGGGGGGYNGGSGAGGALDGQGGFSYLADGIPMNANYVRLSGVRAGNGLVTIDFLGATSAVPEPSTWAMMIGGFGLVGMAMRRRRKVTTRVSYAA